MVIIATINGLGGCGKSSFIDKCTRYCRQNHPDILVRELSTVDYVKEVAKFCGWHGEKENKDRVFLSDLKQALAKWNNVPVKNVFDSIADELKKDSNSNYLFIINSREPQDIDIIAAFAQQYKYPFYKILVVNNNIKVNEVAELIEGIDSIDYDYIIDNNKDLKELQESAATFIEEIIK